MHIKGKISSSYDPGSITKDWIAYFIRIICATLFVFSGFEKIITHSQFERGLEKVSMIGNYANIMSWSVPILELLIALLIVVNKTSRLGLKLFVLLMFIFTVYIGIMLVWADRLPCHCNILIQQLSWSQHILFNVAFIAIAFFAIHVLGIQQNRNFKT